MYENIINETLIILQIIKIWNLSVEKRRNNYKFSELSDMDSVSIELSSNLKYI